MKKTAVIVGAEGQDGKIAFEDLSREGYRVLGLDRDSVTRHDLEWPQAVDITRSDAVDELIEKLQPEEVYYFAAFHHSSQDPPIEPSELFRKSYQINVFPYLSFLEAIRRFSPATRIFYAASSLIFGTSETEVQDENSPFRPEAPYGFTKLDGLLAGRFYRATEKVFAACGIFYNHESEYRSPKFISMKIVAGAAAIKAGREKELVVGDLGATVDWGYARDYVRAAELILRSDTPDDYVVATGIKHTVEDWAREAFQYFGLDWKKYVRQDQKILTRKRQPMIGNAQKLREKTGWRPEVSFEEMVRRMAKHEEDKSL